MKKPLNTSLIILAVFVIMAVIGVNISNNNLKDDKLAIYFPVNQDFLNPDQGTAVFEFSFPETEFKVGDEIADILIFLDSKTIPELRILYNQKEKRIYAGNPSLVTGQVTILDGKTHKIEYTFNRNQRQQSISLDGNLLASGEFTGELNAISGYVVYEQLRIVESDVPIEVSFVVD